MATEDQGRRPHWLAIVLAAVAGLAVGALLGYARGAPMQDGFRTDLHPDSVTIVVDRD